MANLVERFCVCVFCKMWNPHTHCNMKPAPGLTRTLVGSHLGLKCLLMPWQLITTMQISVKLNHNLPTPHTPYHTHHSQTCVTQKFIFQEMQSTFCFETFECVCGPITGEQCGVWRLNKGLLLIWGFIWRHPDQIWPLYGTIQNSWHQRHHFELIWRQTNQLWGELEIFFCCHRSLDENIVSDRCTFIKCTFTFMAGARITEIPVHLSLGWNSWEFHWWGHWT